MQQAFTCSPFITSAVNLTFTARYHMSHKHNINGTVNAFVNTVFLFISAFHIVVRPIEQNGERSHLFLPACVCR